ncbi:hypothetical protein [Rhizobacter sp. Root1221]|uniref:hypothetical protein n=1 Tax=Rhizobacter sp. Root1221 TaxID=1736433 RepID=UPI0006F22D0B|nr:hypothetical protein [Rhizobacter sp. Root1221]KQW01531.1 hypothetical protein ASC87_14425 [Rhizobacter sp. Root1221]
MTSISSINFIDVASREKAALQSIEIDLKNLESRKNKNIPLSEADEVELARLKAIKELGGTKYTDPLFACTRAELMSDSTGLQTIVIDHDSDGTLKARKSEGNGGEPDLATVRTALILGLLQLNKAPLPPLVVVDRKHAKGRILVGDENHANAAKFREALFQAIGRTAGHLALATKVLEVFAEALSLGNGDGADDAGVSSREYAEVFTKLIDQGVTASDPNLKRRVADCLDRVQEVGEERPLHEFEINLPDLEATTAFEVQADHCKLFGSFIFASAFEELRAFQVVDTLVDMSQRGAISLVRGKAGTQLYNYWRAAPNRMSENERQTFYAMTLGLPTGQPGVAVNTDFQDLWLRFVSSVSTLVRESRVDQLLRSALPMAINQQQVKKSARDLAVNMSAHGYGMVFYAAVDLQKQINEMISLLQDEELRASFGARDMWGVIDQVAQTELGGARNSSKYRMLATSGAIITSWMARNTNRLRDPTLPMVDMNQVTNPPSRLSGQTAVSAPTDYDLVNACEMWLADSALGDDRVEQMSQPRESPQQTSRPIQIPSIARDLLEGVGLGMGVGLGAGGNGNGNGYGYANGRGSSRYQGY